MAPVVKREALEEPSGLSTVDPKRSKEATEKDLRKFMKFVRKQAKEHQWPSWWSWNSERQLQEKQKKSRAEPAAIESDVNGCKKPVAIKNKKCEQTVDDRFDTWYRCDSCDKFAKKLKLEWHLREHTGVRPIPCGLCPMKFLNGRLRTAHHTRHHGLNSKWKRSDCD